MANTILALYFQIFLLFITGYRCIEYAGSECLGIVTFDLWNETNFIATDLAVRSSVNILPMYLAYECTSAIRIFACMDKYAPLNSNSSEQQPCLDVCSNVFKHCQEVFQLGYESEPGQIIFLLDILGVSGCPQSTSITGIVTNSTVALSGPCISLTTVDNDLAQFPQDETICPYGMVQLEADSDYPIPTTGCALRCTGILYSDDEYDIAALTIIITGLISFAGMVYVMLNQYGKIQSSTSSSSYTRGSHFNIIMFCMGFALIGLITSLTELIGGIDVDCDSDSNAGTGSACLFEGYMAMTLSIWSMGWCAVIVLELYCNVFSMVNKVTILKARKFYPLICTVLPIIAAITAASTDGIGSLAFSGVPICFLKVRPTWLHYTLFFSPVMINVLLTIFVAVSISNHTWVLFSKNELHKSVDTKSVDTSSVNGSDSQSESPRASDQGSVRSSSRPHSQSISSAKRMLQYNSKIIVFALTYSALHLFLLYDRIEGDLMEDELRIGAADYVECLLTNSLSSVQDGISACGYNIQNRLSFGHVLVALILFGAYGSIPFLTFGLDELVKSFKKEMLDFDKRRSSMISSIISGVPLSGGEPSQTAERRVETSTSIEWKEPTFVRFKEESNSTRTRETTVDADGNQEKLVKEVALVDIRSEAAL